LGLDAFIKKKHFFLHSPHHKFTLADVVIVQYGLQTGFGTW